MVQEPRKLFEIFDDYYFTANITMILYGFASGWTSSSLLVLESDKTSPLEQGAMDQEERSWVTSLFAISGLDRSYFRHS